MLIETNNVQIDVTVDDFHTLLAIYAVADASGRPQYVGVTPLNKLFELEDAHNNSEWATVFGKPFAVLSLRLFGVTTNEREAMAKQRELIGIFQPHCNLRGYYCVTKYQAVLCDQTGETWPNAHQAAKAHQIDATALGHHLKRKPGFKTVKGRTYTYFVRPAGHR